jgi:hypothetical protein
MTGPENPLSSIAAQLMTAEQITIDDQKYPIERVGRSRLRMAQFQLHGRLLEAIEQNPEKPTRWGKLAREKHQVVQFRDVKLGKYIAVSVDGKVQEYGS